MAGDERLRLLQIKDNKAILELGVNGIGSRLADPDHYKGPNFFEAVVHFGQTFVDLGMRNGGVPEDEQWSPENLPPEGIEILEFNPSVLVQEALSNIYDIAQEDFYNSEQKCVEYFGSNAIILMAAAEKSGINRKDCKFIGLVRAGAVAGQMLHIGISEQILVQTKRLALRGELPGDIAIGISYFNADQINDLDGKDWLIADPAGATMGSIVANIAYLVDQGIKPNKLVILNTVVSHKGALFALEAIKAMGIEDVKIVAGGYSPNMDEKYYLETREGNP
ncbi:MAG: hypothetical protein AAB656_02165, partial [Patescibacteria group bacterium]